MIFLCVCVSWIFPGRYRYGKTLRRSALRGTALRRFGRVLSITMRRRLYRVMLFIWTNSLHLASCIYRLNITGSCAFHEFVRTEWDGRDSVGSIHQIALMGSTCAGGQRTLATPSSFSTSASFLSDEEEDDLETLPDR